jgi:hypothetical protein
MQPHGDLADEPERPERAAVELGEVVARDVLDDLAACARERPVRQRDGDPQREVARGAVAVAQRARVAGGDRATERGRVALAVRRVEREHLVAGGEALVELAQRHAGLHDRGEVADVVLDDRVERRRAQLHAALGARAAPGLRARAGDPHADAVGGAGLQQRRRLLRGLRRLAAHALRPQNRSAMPSRSSGCTR